MLEVYLCRLELMKHVSGLQDGLGYEPGFGLQVTVGLQDPDEAALVDVLEDVRG